MGRTSKLYRFVSDEHRYRIIKRQTYCKVPFSSELLIQTADLDDENITVMIDDKHEYKKDTKSNNFDVRFKVKKNHNIKLVVSEQIVSSFNLDVINDEAPLVSFISKPETVNGVSIKFSSVAKDDYRIKKQMLFFLSLQSINTF